MKIKRSLIYLIILNAWEKKNITKIIFDEEHQLLALRARPNMQSMGRINFGNLNPDVALTNKSDTRVSRVIDDTDQKIKDAEFMKNLEMKFRIKRIN